MGNVLTEIDDDLTAWLKAQSLFFVATAPSGSGGLVNISPKGDMRTFAVLGPHRIAYVDLFGSGIETVAHVKQNRRIVAMFCAFQGAPKIIRLHGTGRVVEMHDDEFESLRASFELDDDVIPSIRSIIVIDVVRIAESCGYVVPLMEPAKERGVLYKTAKSWIRKRGPDAIRDYCDVNNAKSLDGLDGLTPFSDNVSDEQRTVNSTTGRRL